MGSGVNIHEKSEFGLNGLLLACKHGHVSIVNFLKNIGFDVYSKNENGLNAFLVSCKYGQLQVLKSLRRHPNHLSEEDIPESIFLAFERNHPLVLKFLLYSVYADRFQNLTDEIKTDCFLIGCQYGSINLVKLMLEAGTFIDSPDNDGDTGFLAACRNEHMDIIRFLIATDCDIDQIDVNGETGFQVCTGQQNFEGAIFCLEHGCSIPNLIPPQTNFGQPFLTSVKNRIAEIGIAKQTVANTLRKFNIDVVILISKFCDGTQNLRRVL